MNVAIPKDEGEVVEIIKASDRLCIVGGDSKPGVRSRREHSTRLALHGLEGIIEYEPTEYTLTARSGTKLSDIARALAANGQYLPFDPPFVDDGATLGGALASGLSGPGRVRYGGARDFVLGLRFVDGSGNVVRGGGKVVKNAAGFDLPKLFVGSCGYLGAVLEWTVKVFPHPPATRSYLAVFENFEKAKAALIALSRSPLDIDALDLGSESREPTLGSAVLRVRFAGEQESIRRQMTAVNRLIGPNVRELSSDESKGWDRLVDPSWHFPEETLLKVPTTVNSMMKLVETCQERGWGWRVVGAGQAAWMSLPASVARETADRWLLELGREALVIRTRWEHGGRCGVIRRSSFGERITRALDPKGRFGGGQQ